jgi:hypothetical protein
MGHCCFTATLEMSVSHLSIVHYASGFKIRFSREQDMSDSNAITVLGGIIGVVWYLASGDGPKDIVETVGTNYMLASTGKGICETVTDKKVEIISEGKAAYAWSKPEPAVLAKFSATCTYYTVGQKHTSRNDWAMFVVTEESSGNSESVLLGVENMANVKAQLMARNFVPE